MTIEERLRKLEKEFTGRISGDLLRFSLEYLDHGEFCLALETLCDYLCEEDVALSESEYSNFLQLGELLGSDMESNRFNYLKKLVVMAPSPMPPRMPR